MKLSSYRVISYSIIFLSISLCFGNRGNAQEEDERYVKQTIGSSFRLSFIKTDFNGVKRFNVIKNLFGRFPPFYCRIANDSIDDSKNRIGTALLSDYYHPKAIERNFEQKVSPKTARSLTFHWKRHYPNEVINLLEEELSELSEIFGACVIVDTRSRKKNEEPSGSLVERIRFYLAGIIYDSYQDKGEMTLEYKTFWNHVIDHYLPEQSTGMLIMVIKLFHHHIIRKTRIQLLKDRVVKLSTKEEGEHLEKIAEIILLALSFPIQTNLLLGEETTKADWNQIKETAETTFPMNKFAGRSSEFERLVLNAYETGNAAIIMAYAQQVPNTAIDWTVGKLGDKNDMSQQLKLTFNY